MINKEYKKIALGAYHSMVIGDDGNLYTWGNNRYGQLGLGDKLNRNTPQLVNLPNGVKPKFIAASDNHSMVIANDDNIYAWGRNQAGELGISKSNNQKTPQLVTLPNKVKPTFIATAKDHSMAIGDDGYVYAWGDSYLKRNVTPERINLPLGLEPKQISLGENYSMILSKDGKIYSCGSNFCGELGIGDETPQIKLKRVQLPRGVNAKFVSAGESHVMAICDDGNIYAWGNTFDGKLSIRTPQNILTLKKYNYKDMYQFIPIKMDLLNDINAKYISLSGCFSMMISEDGNLYACGCNYFGQLGLNKKKIYFTFEKIQTENEIKFKFISTGKFYSIAIDENNNFYTWGNNRYGQLGIGNKKNQLTPIKIDLP